MSCLFISDFMLKLIVKSPFDGLQNIPMDLGSPNSKRI